jgi:mRNA-degrading endonuclease RelE of RelBE toxin-antitoxin system
VKVDIAESAKKDIEALPITILLRVRAVVIRLENWPNVSGAKPMRGALKGHYRIRTGDWRVLFTVSENVIVVRIAHRSTIYEE